jgi:hypothetical protein
MVSIKPPYIPLLDSTHCENPFAGKIKPNPIKITDANKVVKNLFMIQSPKIEKKYIVNSLL